MKKAIGITIGSTLAISALVGVSIFVPAAKNAIGVSPYIVKNADSFNAESAKSANVSFKEALLGTNKINQGNYVLYFGNLALNQNADFFLGKNNNQSYDEASLAVNNPFDLNGDYGSAIKYLNANKNQFTYVPEMLAYVYTITPYMYANKLAFNKMVNEYKNLQTVDNNNNVIHDNLKKKTWAENAPQFSFMPNITYKDYNGKTQYFINKDQGKNFIDLASFIKTRFKDVKDLSQSPGFVIGYKNGLPVSKFTNSYIEPKKDSKPKSPLAGLNNPNIFPQGYVSTNVSKYSSSLSEPSNNNFYTWLKTNYGIKQ